MLILRKIVSCSNSVVLRRSQDQKKIWGYVAIAFNKVDEDRKKQVGADRLCAEWVLKNGGGIRAVGLPNKLLRDYNILPPENVKFQIQEVDASGSSIMKIGFDHFIGCDRIDTVILHNCKHLESDSLVGLLHLKKSLKKLQVSGCYNINDDGLKVIADLINLQNLKIFDMSYVKDLNAVINDLKRKLPNCHIDSNKQI